MSVEIKWTVFETVLSSKSDIRSYRSKFLVKDPDEYCYLKVANMSFRKDTSEL